MRYVFVIFLLYSVLSVWAQVGTFFGVTIQNDFLNYRGHGTDRYYTGGHQASLLFCNSRRVVSHHQVSVTQQLYTPDNLQDTSVRYSDYPYAGLLFATYRIQHRMLTSKTRCSISASFGYSGKRSGARQTQQFLHRAIGDEIPQGWDHIVQNGPFVQFELVLGQPLLAVSVATAMLCQSIEVGSMFQRVRWGLSILVGAAAMPLGSFTLFTEQRQTNKKYGVGFFVTPTITRVFKNRLLQGSLQLGSHYQRVLHEQLAGLEFGLQLRLKRTKVHFTQYLLEREFEQVSPHAFGELGIIFPLFQRIQ